MARRSNNRISEMGVLLLAHQLITSPNTPPVTLLTILAQVAIYLDFIPFLDSSQIHSICLLPAKIWNNKEWYRLVFPCFVHADDMHLYFNMVSFLWKGRRLERKFGSAYFAILILAFSILTNIVHVAISIVLENQFMSQCAVGFSGVIFALKVLVNHYYPHEDVWLLGWMPVPSRYACWLELLVIQFLVPSASFVGHLSGILVGLAYTAGPLKPIINFLFQAVMGIENAPFTRWSSGIPRRSRANQENGGGPSSSTNTRYRSDYDQYTGGLSEEDQLRRAVDESRRDYRTARPSAPPYVGNDDYRRMYPDLR